MNIFGKVFLHLLHAVIYGVGYFNVVGTRLWNYYDTYHGHTVHLHITFDVGWSQFGTSNVAEADNTVTVFLQDKIVELFGCMHQTQRTDGELGSVSFDTSGRELYVFVVHRILYIQGSDSIAGHLDGVQPKPHGIALFSPDTDTTYI